MNKNCKFSVDFLGTHEPTTEYYFRQLAPLSQKITPRFSVHSCIHTKNPPLTIVKEILYISEYFEQTWYWSLTERQWRCRMKTISLWPSRQLQQLFRIWTESASVLTPWNLSSKFSYFYIIFFFLQCSQGTQKGAWNTESFIIRKLGILNLHWKPYRKLNFVSR
jgi:hypothetical protein